MKWIGRSFRTAMSLLVSAALAGCDAGSAIERGLVGGGPKLGPPVAVTGFPGAVAADDPGVAEIGQHILLNNGSAADAAVAMAFALAVTLPSRAGLAGGGACLAYKPGGAAGKDAPQAYLFAPVAPARAGSRPAAIPMLPLGLFALHAASGALPIAQDIVPAEQWARFGVQVSPLLAADLAVVRDGLLADPAAAAIFAPDGAVLQAGDLLVQHDLAATLARLRVAGERDFYHGALAEDFAAASAKAGGPVDAGALARAREILARPILVATAHYHVGFMPNDAGVAAAAAFLQAHKTPDDLEGISRRAFGAVNAARHGMGADAILAGGGGSASGIGPIPASTSLVALDRAGDAVACDLTLNNLFGTGRVAPGLGLVLAASPASLPMPLLAAAIAWGRSSAAFRAAIAASGQEGAAAAVGYGMFRALNAKVAMPGTVPSPGRANAVACSGLLPGDAQSCSWATDPRGGGRAISGAN